MENDFFKLTNGEVSRLFAAALDAGFYDQILDLLAGRLPGCAVLLFSQNTTEENGNYLLHRGLDDDASRSFSVGISANSNWFRKEWQQPVGAVFDQRDLMDNEEFMATRFYREWLVHRGEVERCIGMVISRDGTRQTVLEVRFSSKDQSAQSAPIRRMLTEVGPHLCNAARTANLKRKLSEIRWEFDQVLRLIPFPTMIIDAQGRIECQNTLADEMFRSRDVLIRGPDMLLHGVEPDADSDLREGIQALGCDTGGKKRWLRLRQTDRQRDTFLTMIRLSTSAAMSTGSGLDDDLVHLRRIAVITQHSSDTRALSHDMLWQAFGLTNGESQLASELLSGLSVGDIASRKGLSKQTVRNHLSALMRKTGTRRQVDLVASLQMLALASPS